MEILIRFFGVCYTSEHVQPTWIDLKDYLGLVWFGYLSLSHSGFSHNSGFLEVFLGANMVRRLISGGSRLSPPQKFLFVPTAVNLFLSAPPQAITDLHCVTRVLSHLEVQINGIMLHTGFCVWLFSHSMLFGKCFHFSK